MIELKGAKVNKSSLVARLRRIRTLLFFEAPLVVHARGESGQNFLEIWCDTEGPLERWMLVPTREKTVHRYLDGSISLLELIRETPDDYVFFVDFQKDKPCAVNIVTVSEIPKKYLPSDSSYFSPDDALEEDGATYSIQIDGDWSLDDLKALPHDYSQVYCFMYVTRAGKTGRLSSFPWKGGYSSVSFYEQLRHQVPSADRPEIRSMHYASPGWIELELNAPVASAIRKVIQSFCENEGPLSTLYKDTYNMLRQEDLVGPDGKSVHDEISPEALDRCDGYYTEMVKLLSLADDQVIFNQTDNSLEALKMLLSFYRRVKRLALFVENGKAKF